jgi:chromosome segregation ATPase
MAQQTTSSSPTDRVQASHANVVFLTRVFSELRLQIEDERANLPGSEDEIKADILKAEMQLEKVENKINREKQQCKQHKHEIDEWKRWYHSIAQIEKSQEREKLDIEINWRSQAIAEGEAKISQLEQEKLAATKNLEKSKIQLEAFREGVYDNPIESDPRLIEAELALQVAQDELKAAQVEESAKAL